MFKEKKLNCIVNVKISGLGSPTQRSRTEIAFENYVFKNKLEKNVLIRSTNIDFGFPIKGKQANVAINNVKAYITNSSYNTEYSAELKMDIENFIIKDLLRDFKKSLMIDTPLVLIPMENVFYFESKIGLETARQLIYKTDPKVVKISETPKGISLISKMNKWELESHLKALLEM